MAFRKTGIDLDDMTQAHEFLKSHCRYYTLNSWNQLKSYANNVRLTKLDLTKEQFDFAFDNLIDPECDTTQYDIAINEAIIDFEQEHRCDVYFNGRSDGWLVMVPKDIEGKPILRGYPEPDEVDEDAICDLARLVDAFDGLCDQLCGIVCEFADNATVTEEDVTYTVTKTIRKVNLVY